jgi:isocitrate dehydrogenase
LILSGAMMLRHLGWDEASRATERALQTTVQSGTVTYDLARQIAGASEVKCSEFAEAIVSNLSQAVHFSE